IRAALACTTVAANRRETKATTTKYLSRCAFITSCDSKKNETNARRLARNPGRTPSLRPPLSQVSIFLDSPGRRSPEGYSSDCHAAEKDCQDRECLSSGAVPCRS